MSTARAASIASLSSRYCISARFCRSTCRATIDIRIIGALRRPEPGTRGWTRTGRPRWRDGHASKVGSGHTLRMSAYPARPASGASGLLPIPRGISPERCRRFRREHDPLSPPVAQVAPADRLARHPVLLVRERFPRLGIDVTVLHRRSGIDREEHAVHKVAEPERQAAVPLAADVRRVADGHIALAVLCLRMQRELEAEGRRRVAAGELLERVSRVQAIHRSERGVELRFPESGSDTL